MFNDIYINYITITDYINTFNKYPYIGYYDLKNGYSGNVLKEFDVIQNECKKNMKICYVLNNHYGVLTDNFEPVFFTNGIFIYAKDGFLHRDNGPALIIEKGNYFLYAYANNGRFHRVDGPAYYEYDSSKKQIKIFYSLNGKIRKRKYPSEININNNNVNFEYSLISKFKGIKPRYVTYTNYDDNDDYSVYFDDNDSENYENNIAYYSKYGFGFNNNRKYPLGIKNINYSNYKDSYLVSIQYDENEYNKINKIELFKNFGVIDNAYFFDMNYYNINMDDVRELKIYDLDKKYYEINKIYKNNKKEEFKVKRLKIFDK